VADEKDEQGFTIGLAKDPEHSGRFMLQLLVRNIPSERMAQDFADNLSAWLADSGEPSGWWKRVPHVKN
jgi:hypothetical protein